MDVDSILQAEETELAKYEKKKDMASTTDMMMSGMIIFTMRLFLASKP